ncbi:hypothetical protein HBH53_150760 [Parastagonospora nodorum]|nr:hypothetical protein HBH53_150760 [Parastagonospora nodorum]KAH3981520.1 hypothetical protein HBH52_082060 [Parastagonospora nodorum]KAH4027085.1 hypothetical protein HBI09_147960 [Parastagonospora nodorum]KAH4118497.1 hypothetical protein HBH47_142750 [Parastagonospora nodorum]KAH4162565.1 hypothetical protein HBH43_161350 [Parastagonospora nodorum]
MTLSSDVTKVYPTYQSLRKNEIRVIELHPGDWQSPIVFSLKHVSLLDPPQYDASSYVWGNGNDLHLIVFSTATHENEEATRKDVTATRNLRDALQHFRDPESKRTIWVDALCINQANFSERAEQVGLMRDIYVKAHRVLLWLGLADRNTGAAVKFLEDVAAFCMEKKEIEDFEKINMMGDLATLLGIPCLPDFDPLGTVAAAQLFTRPWFYRVWVVQEVAAGQEVIVFIGTFKVPFSYLGLGGTWLRELQFAEKGRVEVAMGSRNASIMWQKRFEQRTSPADLLDDGRDLLATDARDKVYGLLGFPALRNALSGLEPDYTQSVELVYTQTAIAIIKSTGNLDVLSFAEGPPRTHDSWPSPQDDELGWPETRTWVARWDQETLFPTSAMCALPTNLATKGPPAVVVAVDTGTGVLTLRGFLVDEIVYVAPYVHWPGGSDTESLPTNPEAIIELYDAMVHHGKAASERETLCMLAQILTGGLTASYESAEVDEQSHLASFISFILGALDPAKTTHKRRESLKSFLAILQQQGEQLPPADPAKYQMAMILMLSNRRVFITAQGHVGLGHSRVLMGDAVVWLYGGKMPFVLRQRIGRSHWGFVGECFLYNGDERKSWKYVSSDGLLDREFELM